MPMTTLDELFEHNLKDVYGAEQRLLESLDEMAGEATDREAKKLFQQHKKETQGQIKRLEKVFKTLGIKAEAQPCPGMEGLIKEKKSFSKERPSEDILGFYNLHAAQKVERYEITSLLHRGTVAGTPTVVANFTHPSAWGEQRWGGLTNVSYLHESVAPALKAARRILVDGADDGPTAMGTSPESPQHRRHRTNRGSQPR